MSTNIQIKKEIREQLQLRGRKNQTYNDIIKELLIESKKSPVNSAESAEPETL